MRKKITAFCFLLLVFFSSCSSVKQLLSPGDAEAAVRELLSLGSQFGGNTLGKKGGFSKTTLMEALFPPELGKVLSTLETLGLSNEVDRFTNTLSTAAAETAEKSVPLFLSGIQRMNFRDAVGIVKNGETAATDYLRQTIGDTLRASIRPVMHTALEEYKLVTEWNKLVEPVKLFSENKLNLDLDNLMSGLVANRMFAKIAEKEREVRTRTEARTSVLLQKVFGRIWK